MASAISAHYPAVDVFDFFFPHVDEQPHSRGSWLHMCCYCQGVLRSTRFKSMPAGRHQKMTDCKASALTCIGLPAWSP